MSADGAPADTAFRVADRLGGLEGPWDVFAERSRLYEIHLNGLRVEMVRGPIRLEGYGIRLLRRHGDVLGVGFQASTELSADGVARTVSEAETVARWSEFPAPKAQLPTAPGPLRTFDILDPTLERDAAGALDAYVAALRGAFEGKADAVPSFGSVKAIVAETTLANSSGVAARYVHSMVEEELAIKSFGGPEGRPPGEYWYTGSERRLRPEALPDRVEQWIRCARDARRAASPPSGNLRVVLPPEVLEAILPGVIGFKFTGAAQLRHMAPEIGTTVGPASLSVVDDGTLPWGAGTTPIDDEGTPRGSRPLITGGQVSALLYDQLHAGALGTTTTGSARRGSYFHHVPGRRYMGRVAPSSSTTVVAPGTGGTEAELIEAAGDGLWVQQIGWASPEAATTAFGGEIRLGYRIRGGKLAEPIRGGTVGGLLMAPNGGPSLFHDLEAAGSRPVLCGEVYTPALLVRSMTVAGAGSGTATAAP